MVIRLSLTLKLSHDKFEEKSTSGRRWIRRRGWERTRGWERRRTRGKMKFRRGKGRKMRRSN